MPINLSALNMFRSATNWDNKGVANLDHKYAVLNDHVYGGWLSSIGPKAFREYFRVDPRGAKA